MSSEEYEMVHHQIKTLRKEMIALGLFVGLTFASVLILLVR